MAGASRQQGWDVVAAGDAVLAQPVIPRETASAIVVASPLPDGRRRPCKEKNSHVHLGIAALARAQRRAPRAPPPRPEIGRRKKVLKNFFEDFSTGGLAEETAVRRTGKV